MTTQFDLGVIRTVIDPDISSDQHTKHEFREAGINFTVLTHRIPGPKNLKPFDPDVFETPSENNDDKQT